MATTATVIRSLAYVADEVGRYRALGFDAVKIKVGGAPFEVDVERVRVARETLGPGGRLALDANNAWRQPAEAIRFVRAIEKYDPWWIEEPLRVDDLAGNAEVARVLDVPLANGEIHSSRYDFRDLITQRAADILQPDAGVLGGVTEWLKVARTAASFDLLVAPHSHMYVHVHLAAAVENCLTAEYFLFEEGLYTFEQIVAERLRASNGELEPPQRPGLGLVLDDQAVARYRVG